MDNFYRIGNKLLLKFFIWQFERRVQHVDDMREFLKNHHNDWIKQVYTRLNEKIIQQIRGKRYRDLVEKIILIGLWNVAHDVMYRDMAEAALFYLQDVPCRERPPRTWKMNRYMMKNKRLHSERGPDRELDSDFREFDEIYKKREEKK